MNIFILKRSIYKHLLIITSIYFLFYILYATQQNMTIIRIKFDNKDIYKVDTKFSKLSTEIYKK